jgi:hypothetical protein
MDPSPRLPAVCRATCAVPIVPQVVVYTYLGTYLPCDIPIRLLSRSNFLASIVGGFFSHLLHPPCGLCCCFFFFLSPFLSPTALLMRTQVNTTSILSTHIVHHVTRCSYKYNSTALHAPGGGLTVAIPSTPLLGPASKELKISHFEKATTTDITFEGGFDDGFTQ